MIRKKDAATEDIIHSIESILDERIANLKANLETQLQEVENLPLEERVSRIEKWIAYHWIHHLTDLSEEAKTIKHKLEELNNIERELLDRLPSPQ